MTTRYIPPTTSRYKPGSLRHRVYRVLELRYWRHDEPAECYMAPWEIARKIDGGTLRCKDAVRWTLYHLIRSNSNIRRREHYRPNGERVVWYQHEGYKYAYHPSAD
jgi:hypothetical protein